MQVVGDGPFGKARAWYKQFYNPRKEAKSLQSKSNGHWVTKGTERDPWPTAAE
jgi:3-ketosteroid 9alpha-monooxygenase subunit A